VIDSEGSALGVTTANWRGAHGRGRHPPADVVLEVADLDPHERARRAPAARAEDLVDAGMLALCESLA
jgi:hypothetical protein